MQKGGGSSLGRVPQLARSAKKFLRRSGFWRRTATREDILLDACSAEHPLEWGHVSATHNQVGARGPRHQLAGYLGSYAVSISARVGELPYVAIVLASFNGGMALAAILFGLVVGRRGLPVTATSGLIEPKGWWTAHGRRAAAECGGGGGVEGRGSGARLGVELGLRLVVGDTTCGAGVVLRFVASVDEPAGKLAGARAHAPRFDVAERLSGSLNAAWPALSWLGPRSAWSFRLGGGGAQRLGSVWVVADRGGGLAEFDFGGPGGNAHEGVGEPRSPDSGER